MVRLLLLFHVIVSIVLLTPFRFVIQSGNTVATLKEIVAHSTYHMSIIVILLLFFPIWASSETGPDCTSSWSLLTCTFTFLQ